MTLVDLISCIVAGLAGYMLGGVPGAICGLVALLVFVVVSQD